MPIWKPKFPAPSKNSKKKCAWGNFPTDSIRIKGKREESHPDPGFEERAGKSPAGGKSDSLCSDDGIPARRPPAVGACGEKEKRFCCGQHFRQSASVRPERGFYP